jgi:hypothetical protein
MATISERSANVTTPAAYTADLCSALVSEIVSGAEFLRTAQAETLAADGGVRELRSEDRDGALRLLNTDVQPFNAVRVADGDPELRADSEALWHALGEMGRVLTDRLREQFEYTPAQMEAIVGVSEQLRWIADETMDFWGRDGGRSRRDVAALPGCADLEQHQRDRVGQPRAARRAKNVALGRALDRAGVLRRL